jgi:hypothetical protein
MQIEPVLNSGKLYILKPGKALKNAFINRFPDKNLLGTQSLYEKP